MYNEKNILTRVSQTTGISTEQVVALSDALTAALAGFTAEGAAVAIPGFGTFAPVLKDEHVEVLPDGERTLVPPAVNLEFTASVVLKKKLQ